MLRIGFAAFFYPLNQWAKRGSRSINQHTEPQRTSLKRKCPIHMPIA